MKVIYSEKVIHGAEEIADGCHGLETSFCNAECPMHTDPMEYVNLAKEGKYDEALVKIREKLFLPGTLGRICAHPCEKACRRNTEFGEPISIAAVKRFIADIADRKELWDIKRKQSTGKKVAIVGAGPAGAQAAIDLAKSGHSVTIFEKLNVVGGMMRVGIPEYRLPRNIIDFEYTYLTELEIEIKLGFEVGRNISFKELTEGYDAVVLAHGAHKGTIPPVKGKELRGVTNAVDFLKEVSLTRRSGILGKKIVVIGGGDVAMDCARSSFRVGAKDVELVSLEKLDGLPASLCEQEAAREEGVCFNNGWGITEVLSDNGRVAGVKLKECTSVFDENGVFRPQLGEAEKIIECDTVIFATGQAVEDITNGALERGGGGRYLVNKDTLSTSINNVFVAGDAAGSIIAIQAMALGRKAAISVERYLQGVDLLHERRLKEEYSYKTKLNIPIPEGTTNVKRNHTRVLATEEAKNSFTECDLGFDEQALKAEAERCLQCECKTCIKECIMLSEYTSCPGELFANVSNNGQDISPIIPYSCNICGQCTLVCPEKFKMGELFASMRKDLVKANNGKSPMKGHKGIEMHQLLSFSKVFTARRNGGKK